MRHQSEALAARLEAGAAAPVVFACTLFETEWQTRLPEDGRKVGVVVHHVAGTYPVEIHLATLLAAGQFFLGDHAVRHSYHHLAGIRAALCRREGAVGTN